MEAYNSSSSSSGARVVSKAPFHGSLRTVRKPLSKPWKKPIAPFPPTPLKVYTVDPVNFRDLVQKLTAAPEFMSQSHHQTPTTQLPPHQCQRLQKVAPPPLHVEAPPMSRDEVSSAPLDLFSGLDHTTSTTQNHNFSDNTVNMFTSNSLGFNFSPSSYNWCAFPILSPGTLASLDQSTVPYIVHEAS